MKQKLGLFLCRCGDNIAGAVDIEALKSTLQQLPGVGFVGVHNLLCSPDGKRYVTEQMKEGAATHAVVAACSPKDHEIDFRAALQQAGVNPYLLQMPNIREQCSWVTRNRDQAYDKALALIKAAMRRVRLHQALQEKDIECHPGAVVIGGGIAGIEAALNLAQAGRQVTLIEASATLGGKVPQYEELAPNLDCAPCMVAPRLSAVEAHPNIRVLTNTRAEQVLGFLGNFTTTVKQTARLVDPELCIGCDECANACPIEVPNAFNENLAARKAVYVPFPGSVPNCAVVDRDHCLRFKTNGNAAAPCNACVEACPLEAMAFEQQDYALEIKGGTVVVATGFESYDPTPLERVGYGRLDNVYTLMEFERLCSSTGPTEGQLVKRDGSVPQRIAVLHCVGREQLGYCSGICCQAAFKVPILAEHKIEGSEVTHLHTDLVSPGFAGATMQRKAAKRAQFVQLGDPEQTRVEAADEGLRVSYQDSAGEMQSTMVDMVVLASGLMPHRSTANVAQMLDLTCNDAGFVAADHPILRPAQSSVDGIYIAGCASGPKGIGESVGQAHAAAGMALSRIQPGRKLQLEVMTASSDASLCSGCMMCVSVCPYRACSRDQETGRCELNDALCHGCGTCVATCPSGAAEARQFTDQQLSAEIEEVLHG